MYKKNNCSPSFLSVFPVLQRATVRVVLHCDPIREQYSFLPKFLVLLFRPFCESPLVGDNNLCVVCVWGERIKRGSNDAT